MATTAVQAVEKNITSVALADIQPSNYNPRKNFDETSLAELAESIRQQGVLQPIGVRPIADNRFEIVFGERRYRASLMAELAEIPAIVMEISDETAEEMATYIVTEDFIYPRDKHNHEYGWGWSLLNTPEVLYGREACQCNRTPQESYQRIFEHLKEILPDASDKQIIKLIG